MWWCFHVHESGILSLSSIFLHPILFCCCFRALRQSCQLLSLPADNNNSASFPDEIRASKCHVDGKAFSLSHSSNKFDMGLFALVVRCTQESAVYSEIMHCKLQNDTQALIKKNVKMVLNQFHSVYCIEHVNECCCLYFCG